MLQDDALAARYMSEGLFPGELYKVVIVARYPEGQRVSKAAFNKQLERLRRGLHESIREDMEDVVGRTVAEIRSLKRAYWAGYYRSLGVDNDGNPITDPHAVACGKRTQAMFETLFDLAEIEKAKISNTIPRPKDRKKLKIRRDDEAGSKQWLDGIGWCIEMELKVRYGLGNLASVIGRTGRRGETDGVATHATERGDSPAKGENYVPPSEDIMVEQMESLFREMQMIAERRRLSAAPTTGDSTEA
jgi:hypothetical protein